MRDAFGSFTVSPDGSVPVPQGPGLGVEIDPACFAPYTKLHGTIEP